LKLTPFSTLQSVFLIILSAIVACVETLPGLHKNNEDFWFGLEVDLASFPPSLLLSLRLAPT